MPIVAAHALSGKAIVRSEHPVLLTPLGKSMVMDILAERGYSVTLDVEKTSRPKSIDMTSWRSASDEKVPVIAEETMVSHFVITFPFNSIRKIKKASQNF